MTRNENILKELNELKSSLALTSGENIYTVPAGYFEGLAELVLNRIKAMDALNTDEELGYLSLSLKNIGRQMPYTVPAGYWEDLAEKALESALKSNLTQSATEELETLSPMLSKLKKSISSQTGHPGGPYSVPQGYFENLGERNKKPVAKVVSMTSQRWFRYAAAAVITGVIALGGLLFFGGGEKEPGAKALAGLTSDIKKMNEEQKDSLIDFMDAGMTGNETARVNMDDKSNDVKDLLQGISEQELKDFQEQTEDIEEVLMIN